MIARVVLSPGLKAQMEREARAAFPRECCGLIEGMVEENVVRATALHATRNLAKADNRFEIDPAEQFRLMRRLRGSDTAIVGVYHSHPNATAAPSSHDHVGGGERGFVWLILALEGGHTDLGAFVCEGQRLEPLALESAEE